MYHLVRKQCILHYSACTNNVIWFKFVVNNSSTRLSMKSILLEFLLLGLFLHKHYYEKKTLSEHAINNYFFNI